MVRQRFYGEDSPFGRWLRMQGVSKDGKPANLPSNHVDFGLTASDVDFVLRNWKRKSSYQWIQSTMLIEIKTRGAEIKFPQDALMNNLSMFAGDRNAGKFHVRFWGWFGLRLSGECPSTSEKIIWCGYKWKTRVGGCDMESYFEKEISEEFLIGICRFDVNPCSLRPWKPESSHHGSRLLVEKEKTELGFEVEKTIRKKW